MACRRDGHRGKKLRQPPFFGSRLNDFQQRRRAVQMRFSDPVRRCEWRAARFGGVKIGRGWSRYPYAGKMEIFCAVLHRSAGFLRYYFVQPTVVLSGTRLGKGDGSRHFPDRWVPAQSCRAALSASPRLRITPPRVCESETLPLIPRRERSYWEAA
jgi:hypothetical protein